MERNLLSESRNRNIRLLAGMGLLLFLILPIALAQSDLPIGLQKIKDENQRVATEFLEKATIFLVFLAGVTTVLSPCILPILPAFFAYTFQERTQLTRMTLLFFLGFTPVFIFLGLAATFASNAITAFFSNISFYVSVAGMILVGLGLFYILGGSFRLAPLNPSAPKRTPWEILSYGMLFGLGWVLCIGPILSGVLIAASVFHNYFTSAVLMVSYSLGVFMPIFLLSFFYDRYDLGKKKFMQGKEFRVGNFTLHSNRLIAGSLLIVTGLVFIFLKGTGAINGITLFGLKDYFYRLQDYFIAHTTAANVAGAVLLALLAGIIWLGLRKR